MLSSRQPTLQQKCESNLKDLMTSFEESHLDIGEKSTDTRSIDTCFKFTNTKVGSKLRSRKFHLKNTSSITSLFNSKPISLVDSIIRKMNTVKNVAIAKITLRNEA